VSPSSASDDDTRGFADLPFVPLRDRPRLLPPPSFAASAPGPGFVLRTAVEDFVVDEEPLYLPSGEGEHIYLHLRKRSLSTPQLVRRMRALGVSDRDVGFAGRKDERGVTSQWVSLSYPRVRRDRRALVDGWLQASADQAPLDATALGDDVELLAVRRHTNKLKTGHLAGNRFTLGVHLDGVGDVALLVDELQSRAAQLQQRGMPNYFGDQRFGVEGDSLHKAHRFLRRRRKAKGAGDKFLVSCWQSAVFNHWLQERVQDGLLTTAVAGDLLQKLPKGASFVCDAPDDDTPRIMSGEVSVCGPMWGAAMRACTHEALTRESRSLCALGVDPAICTSHPALQTGTRRPARAMVNAIQITADGPRLQVAFRLPPGSYATVFMNELLGIPGRDAPRVSAPAAAGAAAL